MKKFSPTIESTMEKEGIILFLFSTAVYIRKLVSMTVEREGGEKGIANAFRE